MCLLGSIYLPMQQEINTRVNQKKIKSSSKEYVTRIRLTINGKRTFSENYIFRMSQLELVMACLQNCREQLSLATFCHVSSNLREVLYFYRQNNYSNLRTTCHIKPNFLLCTNLLENLLFAKYLISATATLRSYSM